MTRALLKKQLMESFSWIFQNNRNGKRRSGKGLIVYGLFNIIVLGFLGFAFYQIADLLCTPLIMLKLGWLYFALMGLMGVMLGMVGSVFSTYVSLYQAKDNDMLLAMPISINKILIARLSGVYAVGVLYEMIVMIPTVIVYFLCADTGILGGIFTILIPIILSVFVLSFSCVVGWIVGIISSRIKNQKIISVILVLGFLGCYFYVINQASHIVDRFLENPLRVIKIVRIVFYPLYHMGLAAEGHVKSMLIFAFMILASFAVVYFVLKKSFLKMATSNRGEARKKYVAKNHRVSSVNGALLIKEFRRFSSSSNYMLNCGMGIVLMIVAAVVLVVKRDLIMTIVGGFGGIEEKLLCLLAVAMICMICTVNDMSAPSVSLEGKHIWLTQVLPVSGWQVLKAKINMHLILTAIPAMLLTVCVEWILQPTIFFWVMIPVIVLLFVVFTAAFGVVINLKFPNLTWTNEAVPIKQSASVTIVMFGNWVLVLAVGALYYLLMKWLSPEIYLILTGIVLMLADILLIQWLRTRGARIFETL